MANAACLFVRSLALLFFDNTFRAYSRTLIPAAFAFAANAPGLLIAPCIQFPAIASLPPTTPGRPREATALPGLRQAASLAILHPPVQPLQGPRVTPLAACLRIPLRSMPPQPRAPAHASATQGPLSTPTIFPYPHPSCNTFFHLFLIPKNHSHARGKSTKRQSQYIPMAKRGKPDMSWHLAL